MSGDTAVFIPKPHAVQLYWHFNQLVVKNVNLKGIPIFT